MPKGETFYGQWERENSFDQKPYTFAYKEGVMIGYRWFDKKQIAPAFAFGHGLSYTTFEFSDLFIENVSTRKEVKYVVRLKVKNTGKVAGSETVQMYLTDKEASVERPEKGTEGFQEGIPSARRNTGRHTSDRQERPLLLQPRKEGLGV